MPVIEQNQPHLGGDDATIDEVETGSGYQIRSRMPKFDKANASSNIPQMNSTSASEIDVQKLLEEADTITRRAAIGKRAALEAAQIHKDLRFQAEQMRDSTVLLEQEAQAKEKELLDEREKLRTEEQELERQRSLKHNDVLQKEALRAQAKADVLLQQKKREYALQLIQRHQEGTDLAAAEMQRLELEVQEADLLRQRAELVKARKPIASWIPTEIKPIKVMVNVLPEDIPEARVVTENVAKGASAGSIIGTRMITPKPPPVHTSTVKSTSTKTSKTVAESKSHHMAGLWRPHKEFDMSNIQLEEPIIQNKWGPEDFRQSSV
ncbi:hypothetical protein CAOG_04527 [Capsaspora owczarzaki ATCC 30864]|uniref:hypothetical protein n=1 Tax=Capsaspora owczarzaki (strain ATCC 30864) TaxID=595528 RepID=UPI0001FE3378|nr:hypothetical protein CAOG_04527 [Capsaspora owczarzaki ATCC 30864]|eukprot:XP_004347274.1 hypothetical protein CAOG_04527 [Capsaspora owczarzaki ATCC 30864]